MEDLSEYFKNLIAELLKIQSTGITTASIQIVFSMMIAILTSQFVGDPKVSYKNNPEILKLCKKNKIVIKKYQSVIVSIHFSKNRIRFYCRW